MKKAAIVGFILLLFLSAIIISLAFYKNSHVVEVPSTKTTESNTNYGEIDVLQMVTGSKINIAEPFVSRKGDTISFKNTDQASRNPVYEVSINGKQVGQISGLHVPSASFSPDEDYFAITIAGPCGSDCISESVYVIDLQKQTMTKIDLPADQTIPDVKNFTSIETFVESFSWNESDLRLETVGIGKRKGGGAYLQLSQEKVWQYDARSFTYSLLEN